jgi:hypothetical protein
MDPEHPDADDTHAGTSTRQPWKSFWPVRLLFRRLEREKSQVYSVEIRLRRGSVITADSEYEAFGQFISSSALDPIARVSLVREWERLQTNYDEDNDLTSPTFYQGTRINSGAFLVLPRGTSHHVRIGVYGPARNSRSSTTEIRGTLSYDPSKEGPDRVWGLPQMRRGCWIPGESLLDPYRGKNSRFCKSTSVFVLEDASHVTFEDLTIRGFYSGVMALGACNCIVIDRIHFQDLYQSGVQINLREQTDLPCFGRASGYKTVLFYPTAKAYYPRMILVRDCVFRHIGNDTASAALWLGYCVSNVLVSRCIFDRVVDGVMCEGSGSDLVIVDNLFTHCIPGTDYGGDGNAIDLKDVRGRTETSAGRRVLIANNRMIDNYGVALLIHKCTQDVDIFQNVIIGNLSGIVVWANVFKQILPWAYANMVYNPLRDPADAAELLSILMKLNTMTPGLNSDGVPDDPRFTGLGCSEVDRPVDPGPGSDRCRFEISGIRIFRNLICHNHDKGIYMQKGATCRANEALKLAGRKLYGVSLRNIAIVGNTIDSNGFHPSWFGDKGKREGDGYALLLMRHWSSEGWYGDYAWDLLHDNFENVIVYNNILSNSRELFDIWFHTQKPDRTYEGWVDEPGESSIFFDYNLYAQGDKVRGRWVTWNAMTISWFVDPDRKNIEIDIPAGGGAISLPQEAQGVLTGIFDYEVHSRSRIADPLYVESWTSQEEFRVAPDRGWKPLPFQASPGAGRGAVWGDLVVRRFIPEADFNALTRFEISSALTRFLRTTSRDGLLGERLSLFFFPDVDGDPCGGEGIVGAQETGTFVSMEPLRMSYISMDGGLPSWYSLSCEPLWKRWGVRP